MSVLDQIVSGAAAPATTGPFAVVRAVPGPAFDAVLTLRRRVFGEEQGIAEAAGRDPDDARSLHALALLITAAGRTPVGTGRLTLGYGDRGEALVAWVATVPEARGCGVGSAVMGFLLAAADDARASLVVLAAQTHAERFYRRLGFVPAGRSYLVRGIAHRWMARSHPPAAAGVLAARRR